MPLSEATPGYKDDASKPRWSLLPMRAVAEVVRVLEFGTRKYAKANWQHVAEPRLRYWDAAMRHMVAYQTGERLDPDSGLNHLAHAGCCVLFMLWFDLEDKPTDQEKG